MPKRKEPKMDPKEQFERFKKAAKEHGVDEKDETVDRVFEKLAKPKKQPYPRS